MSVPPAIEMAMRDNAISPLPTNEFQTHFDA